MSSKDKVRNLPQAFFVSGIGRRGGCIFSPHFLLAGWYVFTKNGAFFCGSHCQRGIRLSILLPLKRRRNYLTCAGLLHSTLFVYFCCLFLELIFVDKGAGWLSNSGKLPKSLSNGPTTKEKNSFLLGRKSIGPSKPLAAPD